MLGPAELRELDEALSEEAPEGARSDGRSPYLTTHFAAGVAMTRAVAGQIKQHLALTPTAPRRR
ncbi:MAG: hypothetical protein ACM33T_05965 [Solirubrobacterales bacterium]